LFPNAFTSNRDGINYTFRPIGSGVSDFSMNIFNRRGEQVFETADFSEGWNGRVRGSDASDGIYYYVATFRMSDNQNETQHKHRSVTL
jgi:gliding motility-associated-like protein